jgi:hypothetical protein
LGSQYHRFPMVDQVVDLEEVLVEDLAVVLVAVLV